MNVDIQLKTIILVAALALHILSTAKAETVDKSPVVAIFENYPEAYTDEEGNSQGTSIEVISHLEKKLGIKLDTKVSSWPRIIGGVGTEQFDLSFFFKIEAIKDKVHFLGRMGCFADLIIPQKGLILESFSDLKGKKLAYLRNGAFAKKMLLRPEFSPVPTSDSKTMLRLLVRKRVDAIVVHSGHYARSLNSNTPRPH